MVLPTIPRRSKLPLLVSIDSSLRITSNLTSYVSCRRLAVRTGVFIVDDDARRGLLSVRL